MLSLALHQGNTSGFYLHQFVIVKSPADLRLRYHYVYMTGGKLVSIFPQHHIVFKAFQNQTNFFQRILENTGSNVVHVSIKILVCQGLRST